MNWLTLTFDNRKLEQDYQAYIGIQLRIWMMGCAKQFLLLSVSFSLPSLLLKQYISLGLALSVLIGSTGLIYFRERITTKYIILIYQIFIIVAPELLYMVIYSSGYDPSISVNILISLIVFPAIFINTTNILHAFLQILHYFVITIITITKIYGQSLYIIAWQPFLITWIYTYHQKIQSQRNLFQQSLINESIYELIKKTAQEEIMLFNYDTEISKFSLILSNINNFNLQDFLKHNCIKVESISAYLYQKYFKTSNNHVVDEILLINNKVNYKKYKIHIFIQRYPKLTFFIRILQNNQINMKPIIYEHTLITTYIKHLSVHFQKIQIKQAQLILIELMIKLGINRMFSVINKYIVQRDQIQLNDLITEISHVIGIKLIINNNSTYIQRVQTDKLLLQNLILGLLMIIRTKNEYVEYTITNLQTELLIVFIFVRPIALDRIKSQKFITSLNEILLKISYEPFEIKQYSISFSISHYDYQRFQ